MPATSVFAAAAPIDGAALARGLLTFFVQLIGDGGGALDPIDPIDPGDETSVIDDGNDGRLTFLLLGMDARDDTVTRTDTVMVMSLKGDEISAASIPRDTKRLPNPGGGTLGKVNSILRDLYVANGSNLDGALDEFEVVVEKVLQIEIDYHALVWFDGFTELVDKVDRGRDGYRGGYSRRDLRRAPSRRDRQQFRRVLPRGEPTTGSTATIHPLRPAARAATASSRSTPSLEAHPETWCRRALPFVRTRHGSSDYIRGRHQQQFIAATIDSVDFAELSTLVATAMVTGKGKWVTNFPITLESATEMFGALKGASLTKSAVFKPSGFATQILGQNGIELNLRAVRAWCDQYMS